MGLEEQSLTAEDQLFILMQAGQYLTATRGFAAAEVRICYQRAESLCQSLNRPLLLYAALMGQWRHSCSTDKLTTTMQLAERVHALAQQKNEPALMIGACTALAITHYYSGNFGIGGQYTKRGIQIWRSGGAQSPIEEVDVPAVACLCHDAPFRWHNGETASSQATIEEAISLEKELNDMHGLAVALNFAAVLAHYERNPAEVERLTSELIELSTRQNFVHWLVVGNILRGWALSASGSTAQGIARIEDGIRDYRVLGAIRGVPFFLKLKAEALHLAGRTPEALATINEANGLVDKYEERNVRAVLQRLRGVFLAAMGAEETQIEGSFGEAIRIAREQRAISVEKRAEASYAEYRRQKASAFPGQGFRLPVC